MATTRERSPYALSAWLLREVDGASLRAHRVLFGALMALGCGRFLVSGWIPQFFDQPSYFFKYWGFGWVEVLPLWAMYALYGVLALAGVAIAAGFRTRLFAALFFVGFTYAELIDVSNYLNHYYLVSMLALWLVVVPTDREHVPAWALYVIRFQVAVVYFYAGLAKLQPDWLLHAQPLNIWFTARADLPIIGGWLGQTWVHFAASWAAFLYDTTIWAWLLWPRTRAPAFVCVVVFHFFTFVFFNIGMFPAIMTASATIFFAPSWPRALGRRLRLGQGRASTVAPSRSPLWVSRLGACAAALVIGFQLLFPLRHYLYPGDVLWNEQGMRFAWKVMVREKHGSVSYRVHFPASGKNLIVPPGHYLTARQEREMAGQPDLILALAHHIAADFRRHGHLDVEVYVDALVSLNGRPKQPMIDPTVDLAKVRDDLWPARWITDAPSSPPIRLVTQSTQARTEVGSK